MIDLTVKNSKAKSLHKSFGISDERSDELADILTGISRTVNELTVSEQFKEIAKFCNTAEELAWCICIHTKWLLMEGYKI